MTQQYQTPYQFPQPGYPAPQGFAPPAATGYAPQPQQGYQQPPQGFAPPGATATVDASFFAGASDPKASMSAGAGGIYPTAKADGTPATYVFRLDSLRATVSQTSAGKKYVIADLTVMQSDNPERPVGMVVGAVFTIAGSDYPATEMGKLKAIVNATLAPMMQQTNPPITFTDTALVDRSGAVVDTWENFLYKVCVLPQTLSGSPCEPGKAIAGYYVGAQVRRKATKKGNLIDAVTWLRTDTGEATGGSNAD